MKICEKLQESFSQIWDNIKKILKQNQNIQGILRNIWEEIIRKNKFKKNHRNIKGR